MKGCGIKYCWVGAIKINEIEFGHWNRPSLPEATPVRKTKTAGEFDGVKIRSHAKDGKLYFLSLNADLTYRGYIAVIPNDRYRFVEMYVRPEFRKQGIASILVLFVLRKLGHNLVLSYDEIITDDSRALFYNLASANKIKIMSNEVQLSVQEINKVFTDISDNDIELVIESRQKLQSTTCFEIKNPGGDSRYN